MIEEKYGNLTVLVCIALKNEFIITKNFNVSFKSNKRFILEMRLPWLLDTDFQRIKYTRSSPQARSSLVKLNEYKSIVLNYRLTDLPPRGSREFTITSLVERHEYQLPDPEKLMNSPFNRKQPLQALPQWPTSNKEIAQLALDTVGEQTNYIDVIASLFKLTRRVITPDRNLQTRLGALKAFKEGRGDCDEMTDLFVTFTRSLGINSRRVTGYFIHRDMKIENHAWAEVPEPGEKDSWLPVDPAMNNFLVLPGNYILRKIEETISQVNDLYFYRKGRSDVSLRSNFIDGSVVIERVEQH